MLLKQLFESDGKTAVIGWGRFNPPTIGHQKLVDKIKEEAGKLNGDPMLFLTMSHDSTTTPTGKPTKKEIKNPLTWEQKLPFAQKFFDINVSSDPKLNTLMSVMEYLQNKGYTTVRLVAGSDRVPEYENIINAYNKTPDKSGKVNFSIDDIQVVNAGMRDPDADGVEGMSASKLRKLAQDGDFDNFAKGVPADETTAKQLYDAVRQGMGISESYGIEESVSVDAAVRSIVSTGESIAKTYGDLKTMAEKWVYNNGTLKGFHRNAAGVGKRWYDTFFWNKMENDLRTLMQKNPKAAGKIQDFLNIERDDKGHVSFNIIGRSLPEILNQVGEKIGNDDLKRFGANWNKRQKDYEDFLGRVEKEVNDEDDDDFALEPKQPKDNVVGRQNAAAEDVVNQILRSIDKKAAGEIRNAIAREPNKLQALQRELAKRNIKVGESLGEGKFRKRDIEEKLIPNEKLNDLKSKYLPDWEMLDHRILQAKYVAKDHRHAEDFVSYINKVSEEMDHFAEVTQDVAEVTVKTTTFDVKGLTILDFKLALKVDQFAERDEIEQVRMQGNFGMHENWRKKLAAAGMAGMMGVSGAAGAADRAPETETEPVIATIVIDGETKRLDLTPKGFTDVRDAEKWIAKFMKERGIIDWQGKIERGEPGTGKYQRVRIMGAGGLESIQEAPIEMDPADPMDPMIYGHDKANPGKLKYRMARAAGQLKDLAARVDGATPEQWKRMAQQFEELKMNMEQIRHALEELGKVRKKGGIRSRGITVDSADFSSASEWVPQWNKTKTDTDIRTFQGYQMKFADDGLKIYKDGELVFKRDGDFSNPTNKQVVVGKMAVSRLIDQKKRKNES